MSSGSDGVTTSRDTGNPDDDCVIGKSAKVSILKHLQSFRCDQSKLGGSANRLISSRALKSTQAPQEDIRRQEVKTVRDDNTNTPTNEVCSVEDEAAVAPSFLPVQNKSCSKPEDERQTSGNAAQEDEVTVVPESEDEEESEGMIMTQNNSESLGPKDNVIRRIDRGVVHQICSGQVIVTLSTAVKELVENSLDAGSTQIEIRLVDHGSKLIEVSDNGSGIDEINFEGLALKHHTSKISEFEDLGSLSTFGFRGEALSSLCALSTLTVITRHKGSGQKVGYKIEYDNTGKISSKTRCARGFGTTVILKDLFHTLPVRHREFMKNLKREFHKMANILYGYCLIVNGVRLSGTNQVGSGAPTSIIGVPAYTSMKDRIVGLFGSKQGSSLLEIKPCESVPEEILEEYGLTEKTFERKYDLEGYISDPNHGRSSNDRQFFFINSRPCDPTKISRLINEVYHQRGVCVSRQQSPFVCLHIKTGQENVDVNVTPDKRTLYVQNEKILLATLKASLVPLLTTAASSYSPMETFSQRELFSFSNSGNSSSQLGVETSFSLSSSFQSEIGDESSESQTSTPASGFDKQYSTGRRSASSVVDRTNAFVNNFRKRSSYASGNIGSNNRRTAPSWSSSGHKRFRDTDSDDSPHIYDDTSKPPKVSSALDRFRSTEKIRFGDPGRDHYQTDSESTLDTTGDMGQLSEEINSNDSDVQIIYDDQIESESEIVKLRNTLKCVTISFDWKRLSTELTSLKKKEEENASSSVNYARRFRAKIAPEDNNVAEEELKKQLTKEMFSQMEIVGQFNLGFIIVKIGPDLFIVDQHASDEKYNYEDLEKTTVLQGQQLIHPMELQLPAISENIIIDNLSVFQKNGFDFIIAPDDAPTKRVKLSKIPYSKRTEFGKSDIEELIFMLEDISEKCFFRPTKVREMLASRACRKSVMIGTALSAREMRGIVDHMGEMEQPWNCPHGRPTIRHLLNLNILPDLDLYKFNH